LIRLRLSAIQIKCRALDRCGEILTSELIAHLLIFVSLTRGSEIRGDFAELFESGFEVFHDFLSENVGIGEILDPFTFWSLSPDVEISFVASLRKDSLNSV
jgi:hypothetical protein